MSEKPHRFSLAPTGDYDFFIGQQFEIGVFEDTPTELLRNLKAGIVAHFLGSSSIDYCKKKYVPEGSESFNIDWQLKACVSELLANVEALYASLRPREDAHVSLFAFDMALVRSTGTLQRALYLARRGYLFETALVARGCVEQLGWAWSAGQVKNEEELFQLSSSRGVGRLKEVYPSVGKLYGVLSKYSHFETALHHWLYAESGNEVATKMADASTKLMATTWLFLLSDLLGVVTETFYKSKVQPGNFLTKAGRIRKRRRTIARFDAYYEGLDIEFINDSRRLFA